MASGHYDAQGIWIYGEDDNDAHARDLLNRLGLSVSAALAARQATYEFDVNGKSVPSGGASKTTVPFPAGLFTSPPRMYGNISNGFRDVTVSFETVTKDSVVVVLGATGTNARAGVDASIIARAR